MKAGAPDREALIARMLAEGEIGVTTSMLCISAAYSIKVGEPLLNIEDLNEPLEPEAKAKLLSAVHATVAELKDASPSEIDEAIALYTEHLRRAGYNVEFGRTN